MKSEEDMSSCFKISMFGLAHSDLLFNYLKRSVSSYAEIFTPSDSNLEEHIRCP